MPRPKKTAGTAADPRNGHRASLDLPAATSLRPEMPTNLLDAGIRAWDDYWADPVSAAFTGADSELVREYVRAVSRRDDYQAKLDAEPLTKGSQDQWVVSPWAKLLAREDALIQNARDRLGLSPKSRAALGLAIAEARKSLEDLAAEASPTPTPSVEQGSTPPAADPRMW